MIQEEVEPKCGGCREESRENEGSFAGPDGMTELHLRKWYGDSRETPSAELQLVEAKRKYHR